MVGQELGMVGLSLKSAEQTLHLIGVVITGDGTWSE